MTAAIARLKIGLDNVKPPVRRRIEVPLDIRLDRLHLEERLVSDGDTVRYKVSWIGGANVLYDRRKLLEVGGFSWWRRLPPRRDAYAITASPKPLPRVAPPPGPARRPNGHAAAPCTPSV